MSPSSWVLVYRADFEAASLARSFLEGDGLTVKMVPDVKSPPLQSPAAHTVKSQYTHYVLLVPEQEASRAKELVDSYLAEERAGS